MHILSVQQFDLGFLEDLFHKADLLRKQVAECGGLDLLKGKVMANVFYEPSTRTSTSFFAAMVRLGGSVIPVSASSSSVAKGESLEDTIRTLQCYCDLIVLRHPSKGAAHCAARAVEGAGEIPIINAGDGVGEHPTQALLDIYTILRERACHGQSMENLSVSMVGDLKNGRTVHSLAVLLALYPLKEINLVSPPSLRLPSEVVDFVRERNPNIALNTFESLEEVLSSTDVVYMTRIQKERFEQPSEYESVKSSYCLTPALLQAHQASPEMIVMHPLPRVDEISPEFDKDPRAAYFRQMENGMYARMALLCSCLGTTVQ